MPDRHYVAQECQISIEAANGIGSLLDLIEHILRREQEAAQAEADLDDERTVQGDRVATYAGLPAELRWRVMVLGCSVADMNFWVRRDPESPDSEWYVATEIETGLETSGVTPREAMNNYFTAQARRSV